MKTIIKFLVGLIAAILLLTVGGAYLLPAEVRFSRSLEIKAPPDKVFAIVADFDRFNEWSPWAALDPAARYSRSGPRQGVGAGLAWASNDASVGKGSMTITRHEPPSQLELALDFGDMGQSQSQWEFKPQAAGTLATWSFHMKLDGVMNRWLGLMMDSFVGPDYERGLQKLKSLAEKENPGG